MLFERGVNGDVHGLLRFDLHAGQSFNVDVVLLVLSIEQINTIDELLLGEKVWDALNVTAVCREAGHCDDDSVTAGEGAGQEQDITDALVQGAQKLKL